MAVFNNILAGASGQAGGAAAYEIERSLRFNKADSAYLNRTPSSAGNRKTWTWSGWVKLAGGASTGYVFGNYTDGSNYSGLNITAASTGYFRFYDFISGSANASITWSPQFRDFSAWYHLILVVDTTQSTSTDRIKFYVNGVLQPTLTASYPAQNADLRTNQAIQHNIGALQNTPSNLFDGYLADVHFIDGQALDPTDFGEFDDNNVWQPIEYAGTYGTNGFKLDFSDSSSASALGTDSSGNGNDWTVNNIDASATKPAPTWYASSTLYTTKSDVTSNATIVANGGAVATGNYIYIVPSGNETNGEDIFASEGGLASNHKYWYRDGSSWTQTGGGYNNTDFPSFQWGVDDSSTYTLQKNRDFYVLSNYATEPENQSGDLPYFATNNPGCDSLFDSPTNGTQTDTGAGGEVSGNYATWNPLFTSSNSARTTISNGNLDVTSVTTPGNYAAVFATLGISSGKFYWEVTQNNSAAIMLGIAPASNPRNNYYLGESSNEWGYYSGNGTVYSGGSSAASYTQYSTGDVVGIAFDADNGKLFFSLNGTWQGSSDPAAGTNPAASGITTLPQFPAVSEGTASQTLDVSANFGQRPFQSTAPSGFQPLCTALLSDPTIADGSTAFDIALYGGGASSYTISGLAFSPDLVWGKRRDAAGRPVWVDTVRGATKQISCDRTEAEITISDGLEQFNSDGYVVGTDAGEYGWNGGASSTFVNWIWDAGSSTVANTDGSISSSVRANASAGFSIVSYTGTNTNNATVGHGLGVAPELIIIKNRDASENWMVIHKYMVTSGSPWSQVHLKLNTTNIVSYADGTFNGTAPTSSVLTLSNITNPSPNYGTAKRIAYCWAPVEGYSAFGSYTGNGSTDGPFVYTGFRPKFLIIKISSGTTSNWVLLDAERDPDNVVQNNLYADTNGAENQFDWADFLSNGFKPRVTYNQVNGSGYSYIYAAFAEHPFKTARAR